jgi:NADPH-dependent 2,4-dienoyl-CoA reductase/sulfur reductase-like enzyme
MYDVIVIGAGPAGIAAATEAAECGMSVMLVDASPRPGGQIWRHVTREMLSHSAQRWLQRLDESGAQVCMETAVVDAEKAGDMFEVRLAAAHDEVVRAKALVLATGARELFLPFPGWTLPGVVGVGGAQALLKSGASMTGKRANVAGSGPLLLPVAAALADAGADVTHVLEQADFVDVAWFGTSLWQAPGKLLQAARYRSRAIHASWRNGTWVARAHGDDRVRSAVITNGHRSSEVPCDVLCVGYGLVPSLELASLLGCTIVNDAVGVDERQETSVRGVYCAGEPTGIAGVDAALVGGRLAALALTDSLAMARNGAAARRAATRRQLRDQADVERSIARAMARAFAPRPELRELASHETIVCRCEDVTLADIKRYGSMREAKLHTRAGMGPCQGRVCGPALKHLMGWKEDTIRPPIFPASVHALLAVDQSAAPGGVGR